MTQILGNLFIDGEGTINDKTGTHSITNNGAVVSTDQKKFGDSSIYFPGGGTNKLEIPHNQYFNFGSDNFTIDF